MYLKFLQGISNKISTIKWKQLYSSKILKNWQLFANKQNVFISQGVYSKYTWQGAPTELHFANPKKYTSLKF